MTKQPEDLVQLANEEYCYLTTTGRVSGRPHRIEIWFGSHGRTLYLLAGEGKRSDWVKNMRAQPVVTVEVGDQTFTAQARLVNDKDEEALARRLLAAKYQGWHEGEEFSSWAGSALPVALDLGNGQEADKRI